MPAALLLLLLLLFSFSSGCDRYVENDDECYNRTFYTILPTLWKMLPNFKFRLAVSAIGDDYLCRKQDHYLT